MARKRKSTAPPVSARPSTKKKSRGRKGADESKADDLWIHVMRHGHVHNPHEVYYGRLPRYRLAPIGHQQADEGAAHIQELLDEGGGISQLRAVYCSPRLRARQTAKHVVDHLAKVSRSVVAPQVKVMEQLNEVHTPSDGQPLAKYNKMGWWNLYAESKAHNDALTDPSAEKYEEWKDIHARVTTFLNKTVRQRHSSGHVVCVTHGGCLMATQMYCNGLPGTLQARKDGENKYYLPTASVISLLVSPSGEVKQHTVWSPSKKPAGH